MLNKFGFVTSVARAFVQASQALVGGFSNRFANRGEQTRLSMKSYRNKVGQTAFIELDVEIEALYTRFPALRATELSGQHRLIKRQSVLRLARRGGVGAEIGVFTGLFSGVLDAICQPAKLWLVDPWDELHGGHFPNWGQYTGNQCLPTKAAKLAVAARARAIGPHCEIVQAFSTDWLQGFAPSALDWVYLDASHKYANVLHDLTEISRVLAPNGVILGDDGWLQVSSATGTGTRFRASEVLQAVQDFAAAHDYRFVHLDAHGQWALVRIGAITPPQSGWRGAQ